MMRLMTTMKPPAGYTLIDAAENTGESQKDEAQELDGEADKNCGMQ